MCWDLTQREKTLFPGDFPPEMKAVKQMAKNSPAPFVREVRQEAAKVTWPTRRETTISTVMVFVFCIIAALFFLLVDQVLQIGVRYLFGLGG